VRRSVPVQALVVIVRFGPLAPADIGIVLAPDRQGRLVRRAPDWQGWLAARVFRLGRADAVRPVWCGFRWHGSHHLCGKSWSLAGSMLPQPGYHVSYLGSFL
jgi:hypothetical protein